MPAEVCFSTQQFYFQEKKADICGQHTVVHGHENLTLIPTYQSEM